MYRSTMFRLLIRGTHPVSFKAIEKLVAWRLLFRSKMISLVLSRRIKLQDQISEMGSLGPLLNDGDSLAVLMQRAEFNGLQSSR
jgi:hypothetical protein